MLGTESSLALAMRWTDAFAPPTHSPCRLVGPGQSSSLSQQSLSVALLATMKRSGNHNFSSGNGPQACAARMQSPPAAALMATAAPSKASTSSPHSNLSSSCCTFCRWPIGGALVAKGGDNCNDRDDFNDCNNCEIGLQ